MKPGYIVAIIFILLLGTFLYLIRDLYLPGEERATVPPGPELSDFERCVAETGIVMESYPRQCRWENGTTVAEVIPE